MAGGGTTTLAVAVVVSLCAGAQGQWVTFENQTTTRMPTGPGLNNPATSTTDNQEKDYAWGDIDHDGDIDLVCVRKQPFTSTGRRTNVLFMNEGLAEGHSINGVLVDRTALYATASDAPAWDDPQVAGGALPDQGFLTPTNDRDVVLVDVNNDGWLDMVTAPTLSDNAPNHIGHPRVYMNLGEIKGAWQGFKYEQARIPFMGSASFPNSQPRFCAIAAGDVTGDGFADIYLGDYDSGGAEQFDYNNKLLVNAGADNPGYFVDSGTSRISADPGLISGFTSAAAIADMNGDGAADIVKQTGMTPPQHVAVQHNNVNNVGYFPDSMYKVLSPALAPYSVAAGDLNNDGKMDLVIVDDNTDHYHLNQGNAPNGVVNFNNNNFPVQTDGFGSQPLITDLDNDGWNDVLIPDVHADISGCARVSDILHNLANPPNVTFQWTQVLSNADLTGVFTFAAFDIDNDGWKDLVIGRCSGTQIWMNIPEPIPCPADIAPFGNPNGTVDVDDLLQVILEWGNSGVPADLAGAPGGGPDGIVDVDDLLAVINAWGACP